MMIDISVIIPVYNTGSSLSKCLESIKNQTFKNYELILVDDGSTDNSLSICMDYSNEDNRAKVIHKQNGGVSSARNAGIEVAQGEYITFIDSDDCVLPDYLEMLNSKRGLDLSICGIVCSGGIDYKPNYKDLKDKEMLNLIPALVSDEYLLYSACCKLFKRAIIIDNNLRFDTKLRLYEDTMFVLTYLKYISSIGFIAYSGYVYDGVWGGINKYVLSKEEVEYRCMVESEVLYDLEKKCGKQIERTDRCYCIDYINDLYGALTDDYCCKLYLDYHPKCSAKDFFESYRCPTYNAISKIKVAYKEHDYVLAESLIRQLTSFCVANADLYSFKRKDELIMYFLIKNRCLILLKFVLNLYSWIKC